MARLHGFKVIHPDRPTITSMSDVNQWRKANPDIDESGRPFIMSIHMALISLFGADVADHVMRELEVASW